LPEQIVFTGSNPSDEEIHFVTKKKVLINAGSLSEIERFGKMFPGKQIAVRLNPDVGAGEHEKIITGVHDSKFGVLPEDFPEVRRLMEKYDLRLSGIHSHIGSGFYDADTFADSVQCVLDVATEFPNLDFVDFGGGFGIHYHPEKKPIDLPEFGKKTQRLLEEFSEQNGEEIEMRLEPGKFLVGESTCLLTRVTTIKQNGPKLFVGTDTGFNHLVRPIMYDSYHHIVNISNPEGKKVKAEIVGNICETGDIFGKEREITEPREGDLLVIMTTGAYGSAMSSNYNFRPLAAEVMVDGDDIQLTRKRQTYEQMMENYVF
jgi:diaminopimelate decarboxylase